MPDVLHNAYNVNKNNHQHASQIASAIQSGIAPQKWPTAAEINDAVFLLDKASDEACEAWKKLNDQDKALVARPILTI
jgi:hypothetical protein